MAALKSQELCDAVFELLGCRPHSEPADVECIRKVLEGVAAYMRLEDRDPVQLVHAQSLVHRK